MHTFTSQDPDPQRPAARAGGEDYRELRVHGIGDHSPLSAQGSAVPLGQTPEQVAAGVSIYTAPPAPRHPVQYLNWSRTSRSRVRLLWYLAFPYTLLNTAAYMRPREGGGRWPHRVLVILWGAVLTVSTVLWVISATESATRFLAGTRGNGWVSASIPFLAGCLVPLVIVVRSVKHGGQRRAQAGWEIPTGAVWVNATAAGGTVALVALARPARDTVPARTAPGLARCLIGPDGVDCIVYQDDWVTTAALGSVAVALAICLVLTVASLRSHDVTWVGGEATPLLGSGLAMLAATVSLHAGWSSLLIAEQGVLGYLDQWAFIGFLDRRTGTHPSDGLVLPFDAGSQVVTQTQAGYVYGPHLVAIVLLAAPIVASLLCGLAVVVRSAAGAVRRARSRPTPTTSGLGAARLVHTVITSTSAARLTVAVVPVLAVWVTSVVLVLVVLSTPPLLGRPSAPIALVIALQHILFAAFLLLVGVRSLRRPFAIVGDLVGFWNVSAHPLAALPYRQDAVGQIKSYLSAPGPVALVGHSQGSVLCFTALVELARESRSAPTDRAEGPVDHRVDLVTCGSPLASLYGRFFPRYFGEAEVAALGDVASTWRNFWRDTDPIATPVSATSGDTQLADPSGAVLRKHGDYWLEPEQAHWIDRLAR